MLGFLHVMTVSPDALTAAHVRAVRAAGVSQAALADAIAVCTVFNIITRYADALKFELPSEAEFDKAAGMLLKRGYA
jgi:alkylhydroperoxidase family enzyme